MDDIFGLIDAAGVQQMTGGWHIAIRAEIVNATPQKPHGLDYGLVLNNPKGERILGFDNRHAFDGAGPDDTFDHEHRRGKPGQVFRYDFTSAWNLMSDFFDRVDAYIAWWREQTGEELCFLDEGDAG